MENWKTIKEFPDYEVSDFGNVRNIKTGIILKPYIRESKKQIIKKRWLQKIYC